MMCCLIFVPVDNHLVCYFSLCNPGTHDGCSSSNPNDLWLTKLVKFVDRLSPYLVNFLLAVVADINMFRSNVL